MTDVARLFTVHGRVQGVWFRDSTRKEAERLNIAGHAINLPDGNVEVLAIGPADALRELEAWLHRGPPLANVTRVEAVISDLHGVQGFRVG
jgi:acylphosphatase